MRRPLAIAFVVLVPLAVVRAEEAPKTYDLHTWAAVWKAGDTATVKAEDSALSTFDVTKPDMTTDAPTNEKRTQSNRETYTYVVRCLEADAKGRRTKQLIHVSDWKQEALATVNGEGKPKEPDTSLKGLHVEMTVKDGVPAYRILTPDAKPSAAGTAWLERNFGAKQKGDWVLDLDLTGRPRNAVKVGDSWDGNPLPLDLPFQIDPKASTQKLTLADVTKGTMRLSLAIRLKTTGFPLGQGPGAPVAPFTEGGMLENDATYTHSMAPHTFDLDAKLEGKLTGTATIPDVISIKYGLTLSRDVKARTGGTMPPRPAEKPAGSPK
jgi:hypothetical protein